MEENPELIASRRSCCVMYANIRDLPESLSDLSLIAKGGDVVLIFPSYYIFELMVLGFGKPMQLLRGEIDRFRELTVYVRDVFSAYKIRSYECGCCEVIVARICSSSHDFYVFDVYLNADHSDKIIIVC